jgi:hypothetical protein
MLGPGNQTAQAVRAFFQGGWLEWYALQNADTRELDVAALVSGRTLLVIEGKTGEYRSEIDKYVQLRRRLALAPCTA